MRDREKTIASLAERQYGAFSGSQAVAAGFPRRTVHGRAASGTWVRIVGDTFRMAGTPASDHQIAIAAWLAAGEPAALSRRTAAAWWGLGPAFPDVPEVSVPIPRKPRVKGVSITRTRRWNRSEIVGVGGVKVTSPTRTLLDIAPLLDELDLEVAIDRAHRRRQIDFGRLAAYLEAAARAKVPGAGPLRKLVLLRDPDRPIESDLETLLFGVLRWGGLPLPVPQYWITTRNGPRRIDFAYPTARVALEGDGYDPHGGRLPFDEDRARDNELADAGWERRHLTSTMLREQPHDAIWTVATALGLVPSRWRTAH